jgi:adenylyl-sulfate kinase
MTGLSGSGKSSIARELERKLFDQGFHTVVLDGDNIRQGICGDLGFSAADRAENIRRVAEVAKLFLHTGVITITALISPFANDRELARKIIGAENFVEIFVDCPLPICEERDPKGLYARARNGLLPEFTGIGSPYEAPPRPEIILRTAEESLSSAVERLWREVKKRV